MLSSDSTSSCGRAEALRDYAFDELTQDERRAMEQHLAGCGACVMELDQLRLTTAALRTLPDREIPQRIAFVSDRVFEPSAFRRFWDSGARLGFASACVLAAALVVSVWHYRPAEEIHTVVQAEAPIKGASQTASTSEIDAAVAKAVAQVRAEDAQMIQAAVQTSERKRDAEYRNQMIAIEESFDRLRKRQNLSYASLASNDLTGSGAGQ
jgi:anti-sigma factor RsiW